MAKGKGKKKGTALLFKKRQASLDLKRVTGKYDVLPENELLELCLKVRGDSTSSAQANRIYQSYLDDEKFIKSIRSLYIKHDYDIDGHKVLSCRGDATVDDSLSWVAITLTKFTDEIKFFINSKGIIERAMLLGDYGLVNEELKKIETYLGKSIWGVSTYLSGLYFANKDNHVVEFSSNISDAISEQSKVKISYEAGKSRSSSTYDYYLNSLDRQQEDLRIKGLKDYGDYFKFTNDFDPSHVHSSFTNIVASYTCSRLCDLYVFFIRALKYCYIHGIEIPKTLEVTKQLFASIDDPELQVILRRYDVKESLEFDLNHDSRYLNVVDMYLAENYDGAVKAARSLLSVSPSYSILYEIVAKSLIFSEEELGLDGPVAEIVESISNIQKKVDVNLNIRKISKIFLNLNQFDWSFSLKPIFNKFKANRANNELCYLFSDSTHVVFNPFDFKDVGKFFRDSDLVSLTDVGFKYVEEFIDVACDYREDKGILSDWRYFKTRADFSFHLNDHVDAIKFYSKINECKCANCCLQENNSRLLKSYFLNGQYELVIQKLAEALLMKVNPFLFPIKEVAEYILSVIRKNSDVGLLEACAIVLHFYNIHLDEKDVTQDISNISENLLSVIGIDNLEELDVSSWKLNPFLLTHVLSVDVMDGFIFLLDGGVDVYRARINICSSLLANKDLLKNDIDKDYIINELNSSFNRMVLYFALSESSNGRISVEKESLKLILVEELKDDYLALDIHKRDRSEIKEIIISEEEKRLTISGSEFHMLLLRMLDRILEQYTSNKLYGLDNSLNVGIRHGGLFNHIWAPMKRNEIAGSKLKNDEFSTGDILGDFKLLNKEVANKISSSVSSFISEVEKEILYFRNSCYVDTSEFANKDDRFFKYKRGRSLLDLLISSYDKGYTLSEMIDLIFDSLDVTTLNNFESIRNRDLLDLKNNIDRYFVSVIAEIDLAPRSLIDRLRITKYEINTRINELKQWFDWTLEPSSPFFFGAAYVKANDLVSALYPYSKVMDSNEDMTSILLDGKFFTSFVTIFSLLQENIVRHSGYTSVVYFDNNVYFDEYDVLTIECKNKVKVDDVDILKAKVLEINENLGNNIIDRASHDTGSGIYKIKSILNSKLKVENSISISVEDDFFVVFIKIIDIASLRYNKGE